MEILYIDEEDETAVGEPETGYVIPTTAVGRILKGEHRYTLCCLAHLTDLLWWAFKNKKEETDRSGFGKKSMLTWLDSP